MLLGDREGSITPDHLISFLHHIRRRSHRQNSRSRSSLRVQFDGAIKNRSRAILKCFIPPDLLASLSKGFFSVVADGSQHQILDLDLWSISMVR